MFCAALLERMLPNYKMFSDTCEFGDYKLLRNQLDLVWQWLDKDSRCRINTSAQLAKLELETPDSEAFDSFGVFPALDVCMGMMSLLQGIQDKDDDDFLNVGRLSKNSVSFYVELILAQEKEEQDKTLTTAEEIANHPLMQWEQATQQELYDFLKFSAENKRTCDKAKLLVLEEGLSNLGIEI